MTKIRLAALQALQQSPVPLNATEVGQAMSVTCNQVTIYRTLTYLEQKKLVYSFLLFCPESRSERYWAFTQAEGNHMVHHHWFHCQKCHTFIDLGRCPVEQMVKSYEQKKNLKVTGHSFSLLGICSECSDRAPNRIVP
ncbi:MAG: Fur family transcriptional regulator [Sphaerochaetaceae bacterium]